MAVNGAGYERRTTDMVRTGLVWLTLTLLLAAALGLLSTWLGHPTAVPWIGAGVLTSLVTMVACQLTERVAGVAAQPLPRLLVHTMIRLALPLAVLLAVRVSRPDLIDRLAVIYYLPFALVTLLADTAGSIRRVEAETK